MSLTFSADGHRVAHPGTHLSNINTGWVAGWFYPTSDADRMYWFGSSASAAGSGNDLQIQQRGDQAGDPIQGFCGRATTYLQAAAPAANFAAWGLNKWLFMVFVFDVTGADTDQKLYLGDLTTPPAEPSAYTTQTAGAGTTDRVGTADFYVGNGLTTSREFKGDIDSFFGFDRLPTSAAEIARLWHETRHGLLHGLLADANCRLAVRYGLVGTGTQPDLSGSGSNGVVTGATRSVPAPIRWWGFDSEEVAYAVAGGGGGSAVPVLMLQYHGD